MMYPPTTMWMQVGTQAQRYAWKPDPETWKTYLLEYMQDSDRWEESLGRLHFSETVEHCSIEMHRKEQISFLVPCPRRKIPLYDKPSVPDFSNFWLKSIVKTTISEKTRGPLLVTYLNRTPIFEQCVVRWGSTKRHQIDMCGSEEIKLCA